MAEKTVNPRLLPPYRRSRLTISAAHGHGGGSLAETALLTTSTAPRLDFSIARSLATDQPLEQQLIYKYNLSKKTTTR